MQIMVRDNNVDQALRALKKKLQREGVYREMKLRRHFEKPSEKRAREKAAAVRRARPALLGGRLLLALDATLVRGLRLVAHTIEPSSPFAGGRRRPRGRSLGIDAADRRHDQWLSRLYLRLRVAPSQGCASRGALRRRLPALTRPWDGLVRHAPRPALA